MEDQSPTHTHTHFNMKSFFFLSIHKCQSIFVFSPVRDRPILFFIFSRTLWFESERTARWTTTCGRYFQFAKLVVCNLNVKKKKEKKLFLHGQPWKDPRMCRYRSDSRTSLFCCCWPSLWFPFLALWCASHVVYSEFQIRSVCCRTRHVQT